MMGWGNSKSQHRIPSLFVLKKILQENAAIGPKNVTIGLKNATIGSLEPGMGTCKKILQENTAIGPENVTIGLKNATIGLLEYGATVEWKNVVLELPKLEYHKKW